MASGPRSPTSRRLLANSRFRLLFFATLAPGSETGCAVIALQVDVYDRTHSGWWVGGVLIANILPAVFIGLLLGPLVDRLSRKGLMIASDLGRLRGLRGAAVVEAPARDRRAGRRRRDRQRLLSSRGSRRACRTSSATTSSPRPTRSAARRLADDCARAAPGRGNRRRRRGRTSPTGSTPATFALSALLVARIPARLLQSERPIGRGHWGDLSEGYSVVRRSQALLCVLVAWSIVMVANGGVNVAEVFLAPRSYHPATSASACSGPGRVSGSCSAASAPRV